jgi:hypothetical protein
MARINQSSKSEWAGKVLALIKGGNTPAALAQIKVAPSVRDLKQLQNALAANPLKPPQPHLDAVIAEQLALLAAPRLHRSP